MYKKNKMSEIDFEIQNNFTNDLPPTPSPPSPPSPPSIKDSESDKDSKSDKDSCECDDTPIKIPDCEPTCVPITLELSPVISLLVNKPKVCVKNMAICKPKFFLNQ